MPVVGASFCTKGRLLSSTYLQIHYGFLEQEIAIGLRCGFFSGVVSRKMISTEPNLRNFVKSSSEYNRRMMLNNHLTDSVEIGVFFSLRPFWNFSFQKQIGER